MKKLKIFLLLSILLCFGLFLNNNVLASSDSGEVKVYSTGPKPFEVGDVLPANTKIRISWNETIGLGNPANSKYSMIRGSCGFEIFVNLNSTGKILDFDILVADIKTEIVTTTDVFNDPYTNYGGDHSYFDVSLYLPVTITTVDTNMDLFSWEVLGDNIEVINNNFQVNQVLPITDKLLISWTADLRLDAYPDYLSDHYIKTNNDTFNLILYFVDEYDDEFELYFEDKTTSTDAYFFNETYWKKGWIIIDTSLWDLSKRSISTNDEFFNNLGFTWADLNAGPKIFEVDDELPAGYIKISWDFTDKPIPDKAVTFTVKSGDDVFNDFIIQIDFNSGSYDHLKIFNGGSVEHFNADTPGFTIITLTESVTIIDLKGTDGITSLDYNVYIGDALTWEVVSEDYLNGFMEAREIYGFRYMGGPWMSGEAAWNHGYDKGNEEAWEEGFEYGMEIGMEEYGYYDPITDQWLSVEEYLELYGTDKPGQSDFYNNFDKYFIPAMIIVFGGAIVLTILKVFKGRE